MPTNLRDANILRDFTVWISERGMIGQAPSFQPPDIQAQVEEFRGGGMVGTAELSYGFDKIEFDFDLHTWDEDIWQDFGFGPGSIDVPVDFRGYIETPNGAAKGVLIETSCLIKAIKIGKVEAGKKVDMTVSLCAHTYKHTIDNRVVTEIDVFNRINIIGGVDKSANARSLLGFTY